MNYFAKVYRIVCIAVPPHFTTQDCSVCSTRVHKSLSTRTHQCPNCKTVLDRDHNAAINILKKAIQRGLGGFPHERLNQEGLKYLGEHLNTSTPLGIDTERSRSVNGTVGHTETDPNACEESDPWVLNGNIENLSRLVEAGISSSDVERIPRYNLV